jgi:hypothetical protein
LDTAEYQTLAQAFIAKAKRDWDKIIEVVEKDPALASQEYENGVTYDKHIKEMIREMYQSAFAILKKYVDDLDAKVKVAREARRK